MRNRKGQFVKGKARRARRKNPGALVPVMLANPRPAARRRRSAVVVVNEPMGNPRRRRRRRAGGYHVRRLNPGGIGSIVRLAVFGGGGVLLARLARYWLGQLLPAAWTQGAMGSLIKVAGSGAASWGAGRLGCMVGLSPNDCAALSLGGYSETARSAVGEVLGYASPTFTRAKAGLDAPPGALPDPGQDVIETIEIVEVEDGAGMGDLVEEGTFGDLVEEGTFGDGN